MSDEEDEDLAKEVGRAFMETRTVQSVKSMLAGLVFENGWDQYKAEELVMDVFSAKKLRVEFTEVHVVEIWVPEEIHDRVVGVEPDEFVEHLIADNMIFKTHLGEQCERMTKVSDL